MYNIQDLYILIIALVIAFILGLLFYMIDRKNTESSKLKIALKAYEDTKNELAKSNEIVDELKLNLSNSKEEVSSLKATLNAQKQRGLELENFFEKRVFELKEDLNKASRDLKALNTISTEDKQLISHLKTTLHEQKKSMQNQLDTIKQSEERLKVQFENLANKIFSDNSKKLSEQNKQDLSSILNPMQTQISEFKKKVEDVYDKEAKDRMALQYELKSLKELNIQMSNEANKLTNALKSDNKKQGLWGEMVLEKVLENSGLRQGYEYRREVTLKDEENKSFRPDVIVDLPDSRHIIIDAKTSLSAYNEYASSKDEENREIHLKNHIISIKNHIKTLANKRYENLQNVNTLDFIFMFIPIEGALLTALESDVNLYDEAFKRKIILVSPTTLLVALRAVENTWRYERQAQSIADVYIRAEELYKKFNNFVEDLQRLGKALQNADIAYKDAFKKLSEGRGNLINQATMLKKVSDLKPKKEIDKALVQKALLDTE
ncbi:MAG: recombinase RmuC [Proteobacteria bacterium]|nr:MAG: recombinase RmuC [Pseudomonadota bacterium]